MISTISATINMIREILFMPCINFKFVERGAFGSLFFIKRYSPICLQKPIVAVLAAKGKHNGKFKLCKVFCGFATQIAGL